MPFRTKKVMRRHGNVLQVDFGNDPDPPAPRFPGALGSRVMSFDSDPDAERAAVKDAA